jgi:PAS domain S-box-containing protein
VNKDYFKAEWITLALKALEAAEQGIWCFDLSEDGEQYFSQRAIAILGYRDSGLPRPVRIQQHIDSRDWAEFSNALIALLRGDTNVLNIRSRIVRADQTSTWVRIIATVERYAHHHAQAGRASRIAGAITDINENFSANQTTATQKDLLERVFDTLPMPVSLKDVDGSFRLVNAAWETAVGVSRLDAIGNKNISRLHTEIAEKFLATENALICSERDSASVDFAGTAPDGTELTMTLHKSILRDDDNVPHGIIGVMIDTTRITTAARKLRQEQERLELVLRGAQAGVWERDVSTNTLFMSDALRSMLGYPPNEAMPIIQGLTTLDSICRAEDLHKISTQRITKKQNAEPISLDVSIKHTDGHYIWVLYTAISIYDANDQLLREVGAAFNITSRKLADQALQRERERLALVVRATDTGEWEWYPDTDTLVLSSRYKQMMGNPPDQEIDSVAKLESRYHPVEKQSVIESRPYRLASNDASTIELRVRHQDGYYVWIESTSLSIRDANGKIIRVVGAARDITFQKNHEQTLVVANQRAEAAGRAKAEFLATMSHEIRTPLNGVLGSASLLYDTPLTMEQREYLDAIRVSGDTLLSLLNDILDLAKIDAAKMQIESTPFSITQVLDETSDIMATRARAKRLHLLHFIGDDVPDVVSGDAVRIRQVLLNLVSNAIKFTESGEVITRVTMHRKIDNEQLVIAFSVADSGIGMSAETQAQLFTPFSQGDSSITRRYGGTGLGLSICKRLVELMGGSIRMESVEGQGSIFYFSIVVGTPRAVIDAENTTAFFRNDFIGRTVLLVEPHESKRASVVQRLRRMGISTKAAADGNEALAMMTKMPTIDAIITETEQLGITLADFAKNISAVTASLKKPVPIIAVSMSQQNELADTDASVTSTFNAYLLKPIRFSHLARSLGKAWGVKMPKRENTSTTKTIARIAPLRILVAEDNPINMMVIQQMLLRLGHQVTTVENGALAFAAMKASLGASQEEKFDVLITDIQMPLMTGFELATNIRREIPSAAQPTIVALSANITSDSQDEARRCGIDEFIAKPVTLERLSITLEQIAATLNQAHQKNPSSKMTSDASTSAGAQSTSFSPQTPELPVLSQQQLEDLAFLITHNSAAIYKLLDDLSAATILANTVFQQQPRNMEELGRVAHKLAGSYATIGAKRTQHALKAVERAAKGLVSADIDALLETAEAERDTAHRAFEQWLQSHQQTNNSN